GGMAAPEFARGTHHLEVHLLDRLTWRVVETSALSIAIENTITGLRQPIPTTRMMDPGIGAADLHYGGNVFMPDGRYRVDVQVVGQEASFDFVVRQDQPEEVPGAATVLFGRGVAPGLYLLFSLVALAVGALTALGRLRPTTAAGARAAFLVLLAFQGFHQLEHVVQVVQAKVLGIRGAAGLAGSVFGLEPIHLAYNSWFWALCVLVTASW